MKAGKLAILATILLMSVSHSQEPVKDDTDLSARINAAIDKGRKYLREQLLTSIRLEPSLTGWALLEAGVPPNDPDVESLHQRVRKEVTTPHHRAVYNLTVAIIFLDRLGNPDDSTLIQSLATRLIESQRRTGGWPYDCAPTSEEEAELLKSFIELKAKDKADRVAREKQLALQRMYTVRLLTANSRPLTSIEDGETDNSNTQFAVLALWIARRHGVPSDRALRFAELRFKSSQLADGKWGYSPELDQMLDQAQNETRKTLGMTCAGLIAIALGRATQSQLDLAKSLSADLTIKRGFHAVNQFMHWELPGKHHGKVFYGLWSLERMAVIYDQKTIGGKDWYKWGATFLVGEQQEDGSWQGEFGGEMAADTCFALLFLKRANPAGDLTKRFKGQFLTPLEKGK